MDERLERARTVAADAVFTGDTAAVTASARDLDAVEADLALARGRLLHARFLGGPAESRTEDPRELALFERASTVYAGLGDVRGEGEASFWVGIVHQVVRSDETSAVPAFERALELATQAEDDTTIAHALRHLGIGEQRAGRLAWAKALLEESTRLRRDLGADAGVASNLVGLGYLAMAEGRRDDAAAILDEAHALAESSGAVAVGAQVRDARASLTTQS